MILWFYDLPWTQDPTLSAGILFSSETAISTILILSSSEN